MTFMDYLIAAIAFGVNGSFNPYMLSMVLCFLVFLAVIGDTPRRINLAGKFTTTAVFLSTFLLSWGGNALGLENPAVTRVIDFLSLGAAGFLMVIGYVLFRQWLHGKARAAAPPLPLFLAENTNTAKKNAGIIFFSVILGLVTVLLGSLWPKDQTVYILYYFLFASGNALLSALFFALYGLAFALPLLMVFGVIYGIKRLTKLRNDVVSVISWMRVCFSSIFIAVGLGLVYLFITT